MADASIISIGDQTQSAPDEEISTSQLAPDELLLRIKEWWREDQPECHQWQMEAKDDFDFRAGNQWPDDDKWYMQEDQKRACLTFNRIDPVIDAVVGSEITNRQEVRFIPRQISNGPVNEVLTEAARWFRDQCDAEHEESNAFADAVTCGMGWTETTLDYTDNPNGEPRVRRIDPLEMVWDNAARQANLIDARRVFRVRRKVPIAEVKARWPVGADGQPIYEDSSYDARWAADDADEEVPYAVHTAGDPLTHEASGGKEEDMVTLVQVQWFEQEDYYRALMVDPTTGTPRTGEFSPQQHVVASMRAAAMGVPYRGIKQSRKVYYQAFVGGDVLEMRRQVAPSGKYAVAFSFVPITGKWDRNKAQFYGLVRGMKGPQLFANKWLSTAVEIMARAAKGGLMLEEGAVADAQDFETDWAKPGANAYFKPGALTGGKVQPKPATQFPNDFMGMTQFAIASIRDVTGVNSETLGMSNNDQPATLEYQRRQSATMILAPMFDSLRRYRRIEGRVLLYLITEYLADGRLIRIVGDEGEQYVPLIHDPNVLEYDVIVDDAPSAPSQKEMVWNSMIQMMPLITNMQPPPEVILALLDYSPLPSSVVAKIKQAVATAGQNGPPPPPDPMTLMTQQAQVNIATQAKQAADRNAAKQQEHMIDLAHKQELARLDLAAETQRQQVQLAAKQREMAMQNYYKRQDAAAQAAQRAMGVTPPGIILP